MKNDQVNWKNSSNFQKKIIIIQKLLEKYILNVGFFLIQLMDRGVVRGEIGLLITWMANYTLKEVKGTEYW
jgi:hypothetical protein